MVVLDFRPVLYVDETGEGWPRGSSAGKAAAELDTVRLQEGFVPLGIRDVQTSPAGCEFSLARLVDIIRMGIPFARNMGSAKLADCR